MKIKETDLNGPVVEYLTEQGYTVHCEVNDIDIVAYKGFQKQDLIAVELKRAINLDLLLQAADRQKKVESVYVAVPHPGRGLYTKRWSKLKELLKRLELGLILISFGGEGKGLVEIASHPYRIERKVQPKKQKTIIREARGRTINYNVAGSRKQKLMTAYREQTIHIACCLEQYGPLSPMKLKKLGTAPATPTILQRNYYGWFERTKRGIYTLHDAGREALQKYARVADIYRNKCSSNNPSSTETSLKNP